MYKVYNFFEDKAINLPLTENRGFLYGDGFFESIIIKHNRITFFDDHYDRMKTAAQIFNFSPFPSKKQLQDLILTLDNTLSEQMRLKIIVFRNAEGLFAPNNNTPLFYFESKGTPPSSTTNKSAFFSKTISNSESTTSTFKTLSSLNYVLAGIELNKSTYDEIILLDQKGLVSECLSSNIWWIKQGVIFTPSLNTGCIEGIMRKNILLYLKAQNISVKIGKFSSTQLLEADFCFTSNVAGLHIIDSVEDSIISKTSHLIFEGIKKALL